MTVKEMLTRMDSRELTEWAAFFALEPWGTETEDWRAGLVSASIANANRDPRDTPQPYQPRDFMPRRKIQEEQDEQSHETVLDMWSMAWDSRFGRGDSS